MLPRQQDNGNEVVLTGIGNDINDAHSKGKLSEKHFANLKTKISMLYQDIYNKKIEGANGNGILLEEVKNGIRDAFSKKKINEEHYKLLIEKISDNKNNHGSVNKLQSS